MAGDAPPLGVYVHWPWCARICPYCDFNVYRNRGVDAARWRAALARELEYWAARAGSRPLRSLYFGGGTPSLAPLSVIEGVVETCTELFGFEPNAEITIEANPTDAERARFEAFARAGVGRLSLGVQSFDDSALKFLGRDHSGADARRAIETAMAVFGRVSFDLIYALPGQSAEGWRQALRAALALGVPHLSLYQLTIEPGTAFERAVARGAFAPPGDDLAADLFDVAQEETARAGLPAYEISNHAAPGNESRHNLLYWTGGDYIGVGPGAHGRITENFAHGRLTIDGAHGRLTINDAHARLASETFRAPEAWLKAVETAGHGAGSEEILTPDAALTERLAMGLRLDGGLYLTAAEAALLAPRESALAGLVSDGLLQRDGARLAATPAGRLVLNAMLAAIAP